jgi:RHS repeat-associated protein
LVRLLLEALVTMRPRRVLGGFVVLGLCAGVGVVSGAAHPVGTPSGQAAVVGTVSPLAGVTALEALPSASPAPGFEPGGGGLVSTTWGLFGDPTDDSAVMRAGGVNVDLGAPGWGPGATFAVFDAATTTQLWPASGVSTSSTVPAGILRDGGAYQVQVVQGGVTTRRAFTVDTNGAAVVAGVVAVGVASPPVAVNTGQKMGLGLGYSSADVGVTAGTGAVGRLTAGLPAGWSWSGVGADVWKVEVADGSLALPGVERIVKVFGSSGVLVLGCSAQNGGSVCDAADGQLVGEGPRAVVQPDGSVVVTEQSVGQALSFDPAGRVVGIAQPGAPPVAVTYTAAGGLDAVSWEAGSTPLVWRVFYPGDANCDDSALPPGFVATPPGMVCGWVDPAGVRVRLVYTQPAGATVPRLSRVMQLPSGCAASTVDCDPNLSVVNDFGWDASNRLAFVRDTLTNRATLAGLIDPADESHWRQLSYDGAGRLMSAQIPSPVRDGLGRLEAQANPVVSRMAYTPADPTFAPATQQVVVTTTGAGSALPSTTAADDGGRTIATRDATGAVTKRVWAPFDDALLATIYPNGQAETTVFDQWFRRTGKHTGPLDAFGSHCSPNDAARGATDSATGSWTACAPVVDTTLAASQEIGFDDPTGVGMGLTATTFAPAAPGSSSPFSGNPIARSAADQGPDAAPGIPVATVAPAATTGSGVRLDGGLLVSTDEGTTPDSWTLEVNAPPDLITSGVVVVNGQFCALLANGEGSCSVTPNNGAQHLTIDVQLARAPVAGDAVTIQLTDPLGDQTVDNSFLVRRWSADTTLTKHDPVPAGTIAGWVDTTVTTHTYSCGGAADSPAARVACIGSAATETHDVDGLGLSYAYTYGSDFFGGVRLASATRPGGGATTYDYWGLDDTPAGLPHADQLGELVTVPQRGLPKSTTLPGGRSTTTVYDAYGTPVCQAVDGGNWTCSTFDETRRPLTHTVRADEPGVGPISITTDYAPAGNPLINRTTRADATSTTTDQTVLDPSGRILQYTDALSTVTDYSYDTIGRLTTTTITPPASPGRRSRQRPVTTPAPGFTYTARFDPDTGLQTGLEFQGQPLLGIAYDDADHPWLPTGYTYTLTGATVTNQIDYDSDLNPYGRTWTFADGTQLRDCATTAAAPAACTAALGDTQPGTTASGRILARTVDGQALTYTYDTARRLRTAHIGPTSYGYTWDDNNNLTGRSIAGPAGTGSFIYTYNPGAQLVATTDPQAAIPASGAFDADDNHTAIGADTYTYDALHRLTVTTNTITDATTTYRYDAHGRITTNTNSAAGSYHLAYSLPDDRRPTLSIDASGVATPLVGLPGGLLFRGSTQGPIVADSHGNSLLTLTPQGARTAQPAQFYEPFGAPTPDSPPPSTGGAADFGWQQNQTDGPLSHLGVRDLHTRLGIFLEPDPRPHGSQAGPYSYTNADPVNQSDPTGLCTGWGCVKEANEYLEPIADALTLITCLASFGVACFVTSVIRFALSVLNFAADFALHQDAVSDGVSAAIALLNVAAATPFVYGAVQISRTAENIGATTEEVTTAMRGSEMQRWDLAARTSGYDALEDYDPLEADPETKADRKVLLRMAQGTENALNNLARFSGRAAAFARGLSIASTLGEYGARITSGNLYGCCIKLW